jgi:hypothetical protein
VLPAQPSIQRIIQNDHDSIVGVLFGDLDLTDLSTGFFLDRAYPFANLKKYNGTQNTSRMPYISIMFNMKTIKALYPN